MLRCLRRTAITRSRWLYVYGAPSWTIIDPCTSLVDPRESIRLSIMDYRIDSRSSNLDHRIDLRKSIIYNRIDERCARVDHCPRQRTILTRPIYRENCSRRNQGNRTRFCQVLSEIYRVGVGRKEALEWKTVETELTVQQNGADRATERNGLWNETERTILRRF